MSHLAKKDANHDEIGDVLKMVCDAVEDTHRYGAGFPDWIALFRGTICLIEVKAPGGKLTPRELVFHAMFAGAENLHIVECAEEALEKIGATKPV